MKENRTDPAFADIPYPEPPKARFEKEKFLIPAGICQIHGVVPHYLYLAIRTSPTFFSNPVYKPLQFRAGLAPKNPEIVHVGLCLAAVVKL
jgi:hypothetical protein